MADEPSWDDIFSSRPGVNPPQPDQPHRVAGTPDAPPSRRQLREAESRRRRPSKANGGGRRGRPPGPRRLTWLWVLLAVVVVVGGGATAAFFAFEPQIKQVLGWEESNDYAGSGTGRVVITISNGDIGSDVAKTLAAAGVTKTSAAFYSLLLKQTPAVSFQPGSYALKSRMSAKAALAVLEDPKSKLLARVVLPEGITVNGVIARVAALSQTTGVSKAQLQAAAADYTSYGLPPQAPSLEGYLFPATYSLEPGLTAHQIFQTFVTQMFAHLDADQVPVADRHRVLTLAGLTQKEGGSTADFLKVARVWDNRIAKGMNLQSDATVAYGAGSTSIETTPAQRADKSNPYNTYANPGLPIGPIANPGDAAIKATLNPAPGSWLYFVVVDCSTGETVFSDTLAQQNAANAQLGAWLKQHPGGCD